MSDVPSTLRSLGFTLSAPARPVAAYVPAVRVGNLLYVSGQLPWEDGKLFAIGKVPSVVSLDNARRAAGLCIVQAINILSAEVGGDFSRLRQVVRVGVFVQSDDTFTEQSKVANGASDLLLGVFGDAGKHARAAVGVNALPLGACVEIEAIFELQA